MVWTKDEVDKYVVQVERNCKSAHERNLKGFAFARLYREAADNESAKRYLEAYISESEGDFRGHCLMGQLYESMGQLEKAVASYRRSLELNNTQKELVLKVVRLYCQVPVHPDRARAWADRGARLFPGHPDVFYLRLHLLESAEVVDYEALEDLISEEVGKRPRDVSLHIRLVRLYAVRGRLDEAFSHCAAVWKTKAFKDSLEWVTCCVEMFEKYLTLLEKSIKGEVIGSGNAILDVHSFLLIVLCQFVELHLHKNNTREVINAFYRLDHSLYKAHHYTIRHSPRRSISGGPTEWEVILTEMKAQLYMYCGLILIWLAKEKFLTWPRGLKLACACYLASVGISEPETKTPWVARAPKNKDPLKWYVMACSRLSQVGHFLMATRDRHGAMWVNTCHADCCSWQGLQEILHTVYRNERDLTKSFLASDGDFSATELAIPAVEQLVSWDEVALSENPRSLQNITWVGLHWFQYNKEMRPGVGVMVKDIFQELRLDVPNIEKHITPNMLCLRDIEAFVYAVVRTTAARVLEDRDIFYEDYEPNVLPQPLCSSLSLPVQEEWWTAAYNLYTGKFSLNESGKMRRIVQLGIEKIRAVDERHGLQVQLLIYLGNSFGSKATFLKGSGKDPWYYEEHWKSLEKWSMHYLRKALSFLEKLEKDESLPHCEKPLFPYMFDNLLDHEVKSHLQSVRLALGGVLMKEGKLFEAMEMFEQVKTPPGMYNLAQGYKYLAHVEACAASEDTDTDSAAPTKEYYQNLQEARHLLQAYLKMTKPSDVGRKAVIHELNDIETLIRTGFPPASSASGQQNDVRQRNYLECHSSTNVSDAQESDDNFWVEQPPDPNTKDFIATLSEVALNKGYFQEQMAIRDEAMSIRDETISSMREEINMLKSQISMLQSAHSGFTLLSSPACPGSGLADQSKPIFESTPLTSKQTSSARSAKLLTQPGVKGPLKIDSSFFAGLSSSNSPERRVEEPEEPAMSPTSPGRVRNDSNTSYTEDIHFEPLIPLPEQIEVQTGEEEEEVMFSNRAKLYRYDKDVSAWKDRGIGTMKILFHAEKGRSRILMRREVVHKVCANHLITTDMKLEEKKGAANTLIWSTLADFSEEVSNPEQLAIKFKTQDEVLLFKKTFEECQEMLKKDNKRQGDTADTSKEVSDLMATFAPKPGSWSCSVCLISNEEHTTVCVACGAAKLLESSEFTRAQALPNSEVQLSEDLIGSSVPGSVSCSSESPFTFKMSDSRSLSRSPFTVSVVGKSSPSPFTFGNPSAASSMTSTLFGAPSEAPITSKPATATTQPFVLAAFGVPAISGNSSQPSFTFGTSSSTGSSPFSFSPMGQTASTAPAEPSVFGGGSPEQDVPTMSFGSFGTGTSPIFDPDVSNHSTSSTQTDPLKCEKCNSDQATPTPPTQHQFTPNQSQSPFSSGLPTQTTDVPQQKLFWQQPTGSFQFGKLDSIPPLGGTSLGTANVNTFWQQLTPSTYEPSNSQPESTRQTPAGFSFGPQWGFLPNSMVDFSSSELLCLLAAAKQQQDSVEQAYSGGYDFTPYVVDEPSEDIPPQGADKPLSSAIIEECKNEHDAAEESEESTDDSSTYSSTDPDEQEEYIRASMVPPQKPPVQKTQTQLSFSPGQDKGLTIPEKSAIVQPSGALPFRRILVAKSPLKGSKKQDEDCVLVYEIRASIADREKATRLLLPPNFFNYAKLDPLPGCLGCGVVSPETVESSQKENEENKEPEITPDTSENATGSGPGTFTGPVFGESASFGQLTFSSVFQGSTGFPQTQNKDAHKPFQGAGTQLFGDPTEEAEGQRDDQLYFEPVIPLPEEIKVVTGEEGLEVLFSERAKLYRFDADSGQWKERGIGEIKLLRHPSSGRGRVLMRREQIKKLCANHNITAGMELKPNVGSDRSWVWYTSADYAEGEARPEKLAIKLKTPEIAEKFKQIFNDLKELSSSELPPETTKTEEKQATGCELYGQFISTFAPAPGAWSCEVCYVENKADDGTCVACCSAKPGAQIVKPSLQTGEEIETATNASVLESVELITFQDSNKPATPSGFVFQPVGGKWVSSGQLFTIGRVDPSEDTADDEIEISPRKFSSPSKQGVSPPQKPSTPSQGAHLITQLGAGTPSKFTFSMVVSPGSPARQVKSPLSRASPVSPESPVHRDDDGPHFEPIIPLPEKVECRTGEEGQEVLYCERCKLFRFDGNTSQWKERGIGDIKILRDSSSGKCRVVMRREQIFKLCANHMITAEMELKPFPKSDRAWLWTTLADFSKDDAAAETLAARFRTSEVASRFKEEFDKVIQSIASKSNNTESPIKPEEKQSEQGTGQEIEEDIKVFFEIEVSDVLKEKAQRLELPRNFFVYEQTTTESNSDESGITTREQGAVVPDEALEEAPEEATAAEGKENFLFGSASVASMSFQSVANLSLKETPFGKKTTDTSTGFVGAGSQLFLARKTDEDGNGDTPEGDHDGPHFEPIIPLPDKIDVKTGEEDEEVMFSHRAKLYRFVAEDKQWKDRGVGDIKLLKNNLTGKMRVLMRREQVLKLCANHQITTDMKLQPNAGSDRSWVWSTPADFSEEECRPERLAVRFKNEEIAKQFKEKFERCQEILKEGASLEPPVQEEAVKKEEVTGKEKVVGEDLRVKFKAAEGSWECDTCMLRNDRDQVECAACKTPNPGAEIPKEKKTDGRSGAFLSDSGFTFGSLTSFSSSEITFRLGGLKAAEGAPSTGSGIRFGSGVAESTAGVGGTSEGEKPFLTFGSANQTSSTSSGGTATVGSLKQEGSATEAQIEEEKQSTPFKSNEQTPSEQDEEQITEKEAREQLAEDGNTKETSPAEERESINQSIKDPGPKQEQKFLFGSSNISSWSFESVAASSIANSPFGHKTTSKSPAFAGAGAKLFASQSPGSEDHKEDHNDDDGPHFEPVIPLPDKVEVKTGEEDEEVMFSHRAKLYRFVAEDKQWKDRGVGDIKLLRNNLTGKMRVLMRREQVLKLCANHQITTDMKLQPNAGSDRSWVWSTPADFSEEECRPERLAVRFKNEEIAKQFKEKFERCQEILKEQASLNLPTQEDTGQDRAVENDFLAKFKAAEGSWECDTCMLRNDRDKVKCAACGTVKPGAEISEQNEADQKPLFGSGVPSSGAGFLFGTGISFGTAGSGFSFGSTGTSVGSGKQLFSFGPAVSFGAAQQNANTFGTPDGKQSSGEETPREEVDRRKDDHTRNPEEGGNAEGSSQDSNTEGTSVKPDKDEERREQDVGSSESRSEVLESQTRARCSGLGNVTSGSSAQSANSAAAETKETVQSETNTLLVDEEENPLGALQDGERDPPKVQDDACQVTDAAAKQDTEGSVSKADGSSDESYPEKRVSLNSEIQPAENIPGEIETDQNESAVERASQPDSDDNLQTDLPQGGVSENILGENETDQNESKVERASQPDSDDNLQTDLPQGGVSDNTSGQQETPGEEVGRRKDDHTRNPEEGGNAEGSSQDSNTEGASVKPDKDEERREQDFGSSESRSEVLESQTPARSSGLANVTFGSSAQSANSAAAETKETVQSENETDQNESAVERASQPDSDDSLQTDLEQGGVSDNTSDQQEEEA